MKNSKKMSLKEKESKLIEKIEKAKKDLVRLQDKRRMELGKLAIKHGLEAFDNKLLDKHFSRLSKELTNGN